MVLSISQDPSHKPTNPEAEHKTRAGSSRAFQTTIVGYGRYGNNYIGPKYAKTGYPWNVISVVDPAVESDAFEQSVLGQQQPHILLCSGFDTWYEQYFQRLDQTQRDQQVVEIALKPELVYEQALQYIEAGVKQLILPKPVVVNKEQLMLLLEIIERRQVKAAVSSQWHYCQAPRFIKREIQKIAPQFFEAANQNHPGPGTACLNRVEINFSKENGLTYKTAPPLLELPHALQLLSSMGLIELDNHCPLVSGTEKEVKVVYQSELVTDGIHISANIDMAPTPEQKREYPEWDIQERSLKIFASQASDQPEIEADFWVKYHASGEFVVRPGKLTVTEPTQNAIPEKLELEFVEDQLLSMNCAIYRAFHQNKEQFEQDGSVLTLKRYAPIGRQIMLIQHLWEQATSLPKPSMQLGIPLVHPAPVSQDRQQEGNRRPFFDHSASRSGGAQG